MSKYDECSEEERTKYRQRDKDFRALPFIRNTTKEERAKIRADVAARQFYGRTPWWYDHGQVYWTVDYRNEDHDLDRGWLADRDTGREWAEKWLQYRLRYCSAGSGHLDDIMRDMMMRDRWGWIEAGFIETISRRLVDDYVNYVRPAMELQKQEYTEMKACFAAFEHQVDREREEAARREDREKRKALFRVVK